MMRSAKEILAESSKISNWRGSKKTREMVADQIREIWGSSEVQNYDPDKNALPYSKWASLGFRPKKGSKALKSVTVVERKDAKGNVTKFSRKINLFYYRSVEPITE